MTICFNCKQGCTSSESHTLLTGKIICNSCLKKDTILSTNYTIAYSSQLFSLKHELSHLRSGFFSSFFKGEKIKQIEREITYVENNLNSEKRKIITQNKLCEILIDYPPDWNLRKEIALLDAGGKCVRCGSSYNLHMHHTIRLSQGGSNHLNNLSILCCQCHSKEHGGKNLGNSQNNSELALSKRLKTIEDAIFNDKNISFGYRKTGEKEFTRRKIKPSSIVTEKRQDGSISICVKGFCHTRKEERQFSLSKMERMTMLKT